MIRIFNSNSLPEARHYVVALYEPKEEVHRVEITPAHADSVARIIQNIRIERDDATSADIINYKPRIQEQKSGYSFYLRKE